MNLPPEREADWQAAFDIATAAEKSDPTRALQYYREAAAIDDEYALLHYRIARLLDRLGRPAEALASYQKAKDEDICPLRITAPLEQTLVRISAETSTPLVDVSSLLAAQALDNISGNDCYVDHVHPTIGAHQLIARTLATQMRESGLLARSALWPEEKRREAYARHLQDLGPAYLADGKRRLEWLENWAQRQRLASEAVPSDAKGYARLGFLRFDLGDDTAGEDALREALKRDRGMAVLIEKRSRELVSQGRAERAEVLLRQLRPPGG